MPFLWNAWVGSQNWVTQKKPILMKENDHPLQTNWKIASSEICLFHVLFLVISLCFVGYLQNGFGFWNGSNKLRK
jgi:hypothetical protein